MRANMGSLWALAVYFGLAVALAGAMIGFSYVLGQRHRQRATGAPYESGMEPTSPAPLRIPIRYYLVAIFFVIFDVEAAFVFAWAVCFREVGWAGYVEIFVFIAILLAALVYLWRQGALDFRARPAEAPASRGQAGETPEKRVGP